MQHTPYTLYVLDALTAAQLGIGCVLFALLWFHGVAVRAIRAGSVRGLLVQRSATAALLTGVLAMLVAMPAHMELLNAFGVHLSVDYLFKYLWLACAFATLATVLSGRWLVVMWTLVGDAILYRLPDWFPQSETECSAAHLIGLGVLIGVLVTPEAMAPTDGVEAEAARLRLTNRRQDLSIFVVATAIATFVCRVVMIHRGGSADEFAYTWQAATFAKLHAFGTAPPCGDAFQSMYVFSHLGRAFVQYTPGWPLLMAPFSALGVVWFAAPFYAGVLAVGIARVCRRAAAEMAPLDPRTVGWAGWIGGLSLSCGTTYLLNAGSRYAHIATMALFVWSIEAMGIVIGKDPVKRRAVWGFVLGSSVAMCGACRPSDGVFLELAVGLIICWYLVRGRIGWLPFATMTGGLALWGGLTLVILRLQLGTWFTTGYSLNAIIHPWNVVNYDWPAGSEWKYSIPLATGEYCWFPCSIAVGLAGLLRFRRHARVIALSMLGLLPLLVYYSFVDMGSRGRDWGYGPRYALVLMVPMAVGMGVALAPLAASATRRAGDMIASASELFSPARAGGPWALAVSAMLIGTVRLLPLMWPSIHDFLQSHNRVNLGVERLKLHDAVVFVGADTSEWDVLDETDNMAFDFYPNPSVVYAIDRTPELTQCVKDHFPHRTYLRARRGVQDIAVEPF